MYVQNESVLECPQQATIFGEFLKEFLEFSKSPPSKVQKSDWACYTQIG